MKQRAHAAIVQLIQSKDFKQCISKVEPEDLQDDLAAEVSLILLETEPGKIVAMAEANQLKFYTVRIIMNLAFSSTSPFYKKYRQRVYEFKENHLLGTGDHALDDTCQQAIRRLQGRQVTADDVDTVTAQKLLEERALAAVDELYWYDSEMVKLYLQHGNYRKMHAVTGIPHVSCFKTVKKAVAEIRARLKVRP
jgi:hypothetical protein